MDAAKKKPPIDLALVFGGKGKSSESEDHEIDDDEEETEGDYEEVKTHLSKFLEGADDSDAEAFCHAVKAAMGKA